MRDEAVRNNRIDLNDIQISGIPQTVPETVAAVCRSRLLIAVSELLAKAHLNDIKITVGTASQMQQAEMSPYTQRVKDNDELNVEQRASQYKSQQPLYTFDFLVVPDALREDILAAVSLVWLEEKVFDEWNLREIEPFPRTALNFHGPTGTGKTLAAHAIASYLNMPILVTSYAQIESKYHGEGPKNVEAIFYAAERDGALLFIDEADSLLSKRLSNVSQGSEQAINSMRSQLLISLGQFSGVVIFATNFVESYDRAFRSRVRDVFFPLPDEKTRAEIWRRHFRNAYHSLMNCP
jgi:SpoVK/Ycf46/Vps4 family AAA+-type ATPase